MMKDPPGTKVIPNGFCGCHFLPFTPTSSPLSPEVQLNKKITIAVNAISFFIGFRLNFVILWRKRIYKNSVKQFVFKKSLESYFMLVYYTSFLRRALSHRSGNS